LSDSASDSAGDSARNLAGFLQVFPQPMLVFVFVLPPGCCILRILPGNLAAGRKEPCIQEKLKRTRDRYEIETGRDSAIEQVCSVRKV
jgi:hypothetical protein